MIAMKICKHYMNQQCDCINGICYNFKNGIQHTGSIAKETTAITPPEHVAGSNINKAIKAFSKTKKTRL